MNDLIDIAKQINLQHVLAETSARTAVAHAVEAGKLLLAAKEQAPHGQWLSWLAANVSFSERTAQLYMRVCRETPKLDGAKAQRVAYLPLREAMALLADKSTDVATDWLPKRGQAAVAFMTADSIDYVFAIWESAAHPGYYFAQRCDLTNGIVDEMKRPACAEAFTKYHMLDSWTRPLGITAGRLPWDYSRAASCMPLAPREAA